MSCSTTIQSKLLLKCCYLPHRPSSSSSSCLILIPALDSDTATSTEKLSKWTKKEVNPEKSGYYCLNCSKLHLPPSSTICLSVDIWLSTLCLCATVCYMLYVICICFTCDNKISDQVTNWHREEVTEQSRSLFLSHLSTWSFIFVTLTLINWLHLNTFTTTTRTSLFSSSSSSLLTMVRLWKWMLTLVMKIQVNWHFSWCFNRPTFCLDSFWSAFLLSAPLFFTSHILKLKIRHKVHSLMVLSHVFIFSFFSFSPVTF